MNMVLDMNNRAMPPTEQMIDYTWLGGAIAGLKVLQLRDPEWSWAPFIIDIIEAVEFVGDVEEIQPGEEPSMGSGLDSLGGYVSIVGNLRKNGLYFPIEGEDAQKIQNRLAGILAGYTNGWMLIPRNELHSFYRLVPLRGPLENQLKEELHYD